MLKKIAVLISGSGSNLQALIDACKDNTILGEIVVVVSNRNDAYGLIRAKEANIETAVIKDNNQLVELLKEKEVDLIVLAGYLAIICDELICQFKDRIVNIHPSLLPSFGGKGAYGINVHKQALKRGVKITGATVHFVSEVVDGGPIFLQEACEIGDLTTAQEIQQRVLEIEHRLIVQAVKIFCQQKVKVENERVWIG